MKSERTRGNAGRHWRRRDTDATHGGSGTAGTGRTVQETARVSSDPETGSGVADDSSRSIVASDRGGTGGHPVGSWRPRDRRLTEHGLGGRVESRGELLLRLQVLLVLLLQLLLLLLLREEGRGVRQWLLGQGRRRRRLLLLCEEGRGGRQLLHLLLLVLQQLLLLLLVLLVKLLLKVKIVDRGQRSGDGRVDGICLWRGHTTAGALQKRQLVSAACRGLDRCKAVTFNVPDLSALEAGTGRADVIRGDVSSRRGGRSTSRSGRGPGRSGGRSCRRARATRRTRTTFRRGKRTESAGIDTRSARRQGQLFFEQVL